MSDITMNGQLFQSISGNSPLFLGKHPPDFHFSPFRRRSRDKDYCLAMITVEGVGCFCYNVPGDYTVKHGFAEEYRTDEIIMLK